MTVSAGPTSATPLAAEPTGATPLARRARLGRYIILRCLGSGGAGVVYAAHDPRLDRRVAIKVLRSDRRGEKICRGASRLLQEARFLAWLRHPNVVQVHDVGMFDDQVFIAMELLTGSNLAEWLTAKRRSFRDVLRVFVEAGRGLEAAHMAGLVHGDFKPANVMFGEDGRARVVDFGLARLAGGRARVGAPTGTPGYVAPELLLGRAPEEKSDQYSFCVALWQGLHGEKPGDLGSAPKRTGGISLRGRRIPDRILCCLRRGLARAPDARFPSMSALLEELDPGVLRGDPWLLRKGTLGKKRAGARILAALRDGVVFGGAVVLGGAVAFASKNLETEKDALENLGRGGHPRMVKTPPARAFQDRLCLEERGETRQLGRDRRRQLRGAFAEQGTGDGDSFTGVEQALDTYLVRWSGALREVCEATFQHGEQSIELLRLRRGCLEDRLQSLETLVDGMIRSGPLTPKQAEDAVLHLPEIGLCRSAKVLEGLALRDRPPISESALEELRHLDSEGLSLLALHRNAEAVAALEKAAQSAAALRLRSREAEARLRQAEALERLRDRRGRREALSEAVYAAQAAPDARLLLRASLELLEVAQLDRDPIAVERWKRLATATLAQLEHGHPPGEPPEPSARPLPDAGRAEDGRLCP